LRKEDRSSAVAPVCNYLKNDQDNKMNEKKTSGSAEERIAQPSPARETLRVNKESKVVTGAMGETSVATVTTATTDDLKNKFAPGTIPLSTDFSNLIDIAECGRRAVGQSADQTDNSIGAGLSVAGDTDAANKGKLSVKAGKGITVDGSGVSVNIPTVLPAGMIVMFSGSSIPDGWALCDGGDKRPNLINHFILGGQLSDIGRAGGPKLETDKSYTAKSDSQAPAITTTVSPTTLTESQIPAHQHTIHAQNNSSKYVYAGSDYVDVVNSSPVRAANTNNEYSDGDAYIAASAGGGQGHAHSASSTAPAHAHTVTITTPYYMLAFIIKL
jgi:microcystin-dependent protein